MSTSGSAVRIAHLYPEVLGTYGDGGNAVVLAKRAQWRGLAVAIIEVRVGESVPQECDIYLLGGGEDAAQTAALSSLTRGAGLAGAAASEKMIFAVCAGMQLLGHTYEVRGGREIPGLGLLDLTTRRMTTRAVGEVIVECTEMKLGTLTGFENHGGGSTLGPDAEALGQVVRGIGNGHGGGEGAVQGSILATYLHGPVLARNPQLADHLLARATGATLEPLELTETADLRASLLG